MKLHLQLTCILGSLVFLTGMIEAASPETSEEVQTYLDHSAENTHSYRFFPETYYQEMPVQFSTSYAPIVEVEIDGKLYPITIILGSKFQLCLNEDILADMQKKAHDISEWKDIRGDSYQSPSYVIPKIKIGDIILTDVIAREEREEYKKNIFLSDITVTSTHPLIQNVGSLGRPLLEKFNLLLDLQNSIIIATNDQEKLRDKGFDLDKMVKVHLEEGRGVILKADTDIGTKKFDLNTGCTLNIIRTSLVQDKECQKDPCELDVFTTSKFVIGESNFGEVALFPFEITPMLHEIDGSLGMEFLQNHVVYIDYPNKVAYIGNSLSGSSQPFSDSLAKQ